MIAPGPPKTATKRATRTSAAGTVHVRVRAMSDSDFDLVLGVLGGLFGLWRLRNEQEILRDREAEERFERERRGRAQKRPRLFDVVVIVLVASAALAAQEHRTDALDEFAREPPAAEPSGYIVAVPTLGGVHVSSRFASRSSTRSDDSSTGWLSSARRTQRRLASGARLAADNGRPARALLAALAPLRQPSRRHAPRSRAPAGPLLGNLGLSPCVFMKA